MIRHMMAGLAALLLLPGAAVAQDKPTTDTRELMAAANQPDAAVASSYRLGAYDDQPTFLRVREALVRVTAPPIPVKKPFGQNLAGASWYNPRQIFGNLLMGGQWNINWNVIPSEQLDSMGYPKTWDPAVNYKRLMGAPTGGWVNPTSVACSWKGSGNVAFSAARNKVVGDHTLAFDIPVWGGTNMWFEVTGVQPSDPLRAFECHDTKVAAIGRFSREIVETNKVYDTLRYMDWSATNNNPGRTLATRANPDSLDRPAEAIENQVALANATNTNMWVNGGWNDDPALNEYNARYVHDNLKPGLNVKFELGNEVWNFGFIQAGQNLAEATALKIVPTNNGYGAWQNYSRRYILAVAPWERIFADRPGALIRVLGTQVSYPEVTRQELKYPGILDHIDAIAGAPYFNHDNTKPYSVALLRAGITQAVAWLKSTCDIARAAKASLSCYTYEGGQHEYVNDLFPLDQFIKVQRSPEMGAAYTEYLTAMSKVTGGPADLFMHFSDVSQITKYGAWGLKEYSGQTDSVKQAAVDKYLAQ